MEIHTAEPLSPISVGDYLYEVSFPDPLAVPRGHILQVAAKQHVISTHARDQVTHITKVCVKAVPTPDGLFQMCDEIPSTSVSTKAETVSFGSTDKTFLLAQEFKGIGCRLCWL